MDELRSPIYLVTPSDLSRDLVSLVEGACAGGVGMVQLRLKRVSTRDFLVLAQRLLAPARAVGIPLIINDRVDVCLATGADGVHLGQDDLPVAAARAMLGPHRIIGATTQTPELALRAQAEGADYVAVGPMFASPVKPEKLPVGPERLKAVKEAVDIPVCAIGGLTRASIAQVAQAGADLFAVVSDIADDPQPAQAVRGLLEALR